MEDSSLIKFVIEELANEPFSYTFNVASFGALRREELIDILKAVLEEIDHQQKGQLGNDIPPDVCIARILETLRILRYWPKFNDPEAIREALERPIPETIWEILEWLLRKQDELKQRSYLAQFLVKVGIPDESMLEDDIAQCYENYEAKIEEFKETHKRLQDMLATNQNKKQVSELVQDLEHIDHDKECLQRKVDTIKSRVEEFAGKEEMLATAKQIRKTREDRLNIEKQLRDEEFKFFRSNRKAEVYQGRLKELEERNKDRTAEGALQRVQQDHEVMKYMVDIKMPYEMQCLERTLVALRITEEQPPECRADLEHIMQRIQSVNREIQFYELQFKELDKDPAVRFAKQQRFKNKEKTVHLLQDVHRLTDDLSKLTAIARMKLHEKQALLDSCEDVMLTSRGYKDYVKVMRVKSGQYKGHRAQLQGLQAEVGHLCATKFILDGELRSSEEDLQAVETQLGIVGFASTQQQLENLSSEKCIVEQKKMETIYEMATLAKNLNDNILQRKTELQPIMNETNVQKQKLLVLQEDLEKVRREMELEMNPIDAENNRLEKYVDKLQSDYDKDANLFSKMKAEIPIMEEYIRRAQDVTADADGAAGDHAVSRQRNPRDRLQTQIVDSERVQEVLNEELDRLDEIQEYDESQSVMWRNLNRMLKAKIWHLTNRENIDNGDDSTTDDSASVSYDIASN